MRYIEAFLSVLLIVGFINFFRQISFEQDHVTGRELLLFFVKASLLEAIKLYAVGVLLIAMLRPT